MSTFLQALVLSQNAKNGISSGVVSIEATMGSTLYVSGTTMLHNTATIHSSLNVSGGVAFFGQSGLSSRFYGGTTAANLTANTIGTILLTLGLVSNTA